MALPTTTALTAPTVPSPPSTLIASQHLAGWETLLMALGLAFLVFLGGGSKGEMQLRDADVESSEAVDMGALIDGSAYPRSE